VFFEDETELFCLLQCLIPPAIALRRRSSGIFAIRSSILAISQKPEGKTLRSRIPLSLREITLLHRDAFGFREHDRRSEVSAEAERGRKVI